MHNKTNTIVRMILSTLTPPVYKHVYHIIGCPKKQPLFLEIFSRNRFILTITGVKEHGLDRHHILIFLFVHLYRMV